MSLARQIIESAVDESAVDIDDELLSKVKEKAVGMFTKIVGRPPRADEFTDFFKSIDHARYIQSNVYTGSKVKVIVPNDKEGPARISKYVQRWEVARRLGSSPKLGTFVDGVKVFPMAGDYPSISVVWPSSKTLYAYVDHAGNIGRIGRPQLKPRQYGETVDAAKQGEKLDVVFYTWKSSTNTSGDQRFRSLLRRFNIPHKRKSTRMEKPAGHPVDTSFAPDYETHVWVNCQPGDAEARQVLFNHRASDEDTSRWRSAFDATRQSISKVSSRFRNGRLLNVLNLKSHE